MILKRLSVLNYKNIQEVGLSFSPKLNCFVGNNGMGKTNFLDAIYYLSFCRSYINTPEAQVINWGQDMCLIQGFYDYDGRDVELLCALKRGQRRVFKRDKKEYDRLSDHIGILPLVMVSPLDSVLIQGGSDERRRFMDLIISQQDKPYLQALIQYNKVLTSRNALLKEPSPNYSLFEVLDSQLVAYGLAIHEKRKALVEEFTPIFNRYYRLISGSTEEIGLEYISQLADGDFEERLKLNCERDRVVGYTTVGAHKDELEMRLGDYLIRRVGSQGQNKTYLIALKLAQYTFLSRKSLTRPILLLDDIFDKLDAERVGQIISLVRQDEFGQIFITDTNRKYLDEILAAVENDHMLFQVDQGAVRSLG